MFVLRISRKPIDCRCTTVEAMMSRRATSESRSNCFLSSPILTKLAARCFVDGRVYIYPNSPPSPPLLLNSSYYHRGDLNGWLSGFFVDACEDTQPLAFNYQFPYPSFSHRSYSRKEKNTASRREKEAARLMPAAKALLA